ncbi:hypothetical protein CPB84DRAFT_194380 [Gymnopilus junonius]|uniref:Uncharacterized protein n=1 Tax=Gymnopilus junonius TaxID=109634 RepID=A0A9P5NH39_GYMJU|nr:hypothetical protein CPB84DRAFT_194380 [Gymnopilus junonius]
MLQSELWLTIHFTHQAAKEGDYSTRFSPYVYHLPRHQRFILTVEARLFTRCTVTHAVFGREKNDFSHLTTEYVLDLMSENAIFILNEVLVMQYRQLGDTVIRMWPLDMRNCAQETPSRDGHLGLRSSVSYVPETLFASACKDLTGRIVDGSCVLVTLQRYMLIHPL